MKKFVFFLFCISLVIPCFGKTIIVTPGGTKTIQQAIDSAANGDIIKLSKGEYKGKGNQKISFKGKKISVRCEYYSETAETIISCDANSYAFKFERGETSKSILDGITINATTSDPNDPNYPGTINCLETASPLITNCIISGYETGLYVKGSKDDNSTCKPVITWCEFINSIESGKHAVQLEDCTVRLEYCVIENNMAAGTNGAGIYAVRSHVTVDGCMLSRNISENEGGAIYVDNHNIYGDPNAATVITSDNIGSLTISDSDIYENSAIAGAGIYSMISDVSIENCDIYDNDNGGVTIASNDNVLTAITDSYFYGNTAGRGVIDCKTNELLMMGCEVSENAGGGIYAEANSVGIESCLINNNLVGAAGGGIYIDSDIPDAMIGIFDSEVNYNLNLKGAAVHITGGYIAIGSCDIKNNNSTIEGGGIYISSKDGSGAGSLDVNDCIIYQNKGTNLTGAGVYSQLSDSTVRNCTITNNSVSGITNECGGIEGKATISNCQVKSNTGKKGGIFLDVNNVTITDCIITSNKGAGLKIDGHNNGTLTVSGSDISTNTGEGIYSVLGNTDIANCNISKNYYGVSISTTNEGKLSVSDSQILNNSKGAGIYSQVNDVTVSDCEISSNGKGINLTYANKTGQISVSGCTISKNLNGDGIYAEVNNATIVNSTISGNDGGINVTTENEGLMTVANCNIIDNSESNGIYGEMNNAAVSNCTLKGNGGGIYFSSYIDEGDISISDCNICHNIGSGNGGINSNGKHVTISDCLIDDHDGSGVYIDTDKNNASVEIWDCQITKNVADEGAGIYVFLNPCMDTQATVRNCTIVGNKSKNEGGSGVYLQSTDNMVNSSIIWNNLTEQLYVNDDGTNTVKYSDIEGGWSGVGNVDKDPFFVLAGHWEDTDEWVNGNYHPLIGSPCINSGDPLFTWFMTDEDDIDLDGDPRIKWDRVDMGSDESINRVLTVDPNDPNRLNYKYATIQEAVNDSNDWDFIKLLPIIYRGAGNRDVNFRVNDLIKDLIVESIDTDDPAIAARTIIDCQGTKSNPHCAFILKGQENPARIEGITIRNGYGNYNLYNFKLYSLGGAIYCENTAATITNVMVRKCNIIDNKAEFGGGIFGNAGPIEDCKITNNSAVMEGGGLYLCNGDISRCSIIGNTANRGGGISYSDGDITDCNISQNTAVANSIDEGYGGGIYACDGQISQCEISRNEATLGGGLNLCGGTIVNCNITGNSNVGAYGCDGQIMSSNITGNSSHITSKGKYGYGGGLFDCQADIVGCTIVKNTAENFGGGIAACYGNITSSILWSNMAGGVPNQLPDNTDDDPDQPMPSYSCIEGIQVQAGGTDLNKNINSDPCFVNPDSGNYHLKTSSLCIDKGDPGFVAGEYKDIDGSVRVFDGRVDIGADEMPVDLNHDGKVDYKDYAMLAQSWGSHSGDANWNAICDLNGDDVIDANDLAYLAEDWLFGL